MTWVLVLVMAITAVVVGLLLARIERVRIQERHAGSQEAAEVPREDTG